MNDDNEYCDESPRRRLARLRRERGKLFDRTKLLALNSVAEERNLTPQEQSEYDSTMADIADLSAKIGPLERECFAE